MLPALPGNLPHMSRRFDATVVWMNQKPLVPNRSYLIKQTTQVTQARVRQIRYRIDVNTLEHELAFDIPRELKKAVALGDLSENAEYHTAKQRQEYLKARVRQLGQRLADLSLVNMNNIPKDKVGLGSTVTIFDGTKNEEKEYQLVASEQSDVVNGKISTTSPIGRALLNKKVGDTATVVTPGGSREMEILKLSTMHDIAEAKLASDLEEEPEREVE